MPPRKPNSAPPLEGCRIAVSGTFPGLSQAAVLKLAVGLGAASASSVTQDTTHLITTLADFNKLSAKVVKAKDFGIHIVDIEWLNDCVATNAKEDETKYALAPNVQPLNGSNNASQHTNGSSANGTRKRAPSPVLDSATPSTEPKTKKKKSSKVEKAENPVDDVQNLKIEDDDEDAKLASAVGVGQITKRRDIQIPLDEGCPLATYAVFIDPSGVIYDASLNQTNASNNNNKFYRIQLLHNGNGDYQVWTRWGRVGDRGQTKLLPASSLDEALRQFDLKFKSKSGLSWSDRGEKPKPKSYTFIEKSYAVDSDDEDDSVAKDKGKQVGSYKPPTSKLLPAVQHLMQLIFNQQFFAAAMQELNYDVNKLPLGKLSKATITRGFQALKDLSALLDDPNMAAVYGEPYNSAVESLSNSFYSFIPHAFGRNRPPVITSQQMLKKEIELLESLSDMKDAALIMKLDKIGDEDIHPLDKQYQGLGMKEMTPLDPQSVEFAQLHEYLMATRGATHVANYQIEAIFRIERNGEHDRFDQSIFAGPPRDRRLLWHGSRSTNFGGILSQGLRIAPPEAPVSGYMFGKGVYLADMSSKSANYCCAYLSNQTALLLLCEAELGNPIQTLTHSSYTAGEDAKQKGMHSTWGQGRTGPSQWKDAGSVHPSLAGVMMPDTTASPPGDTNVDGAYLAYNEYICYDVSQIRLRYLFRVKM